MEDRSYQSIHCDQIWHQLYYNRCVCAQLPTGGGKTVEFALLTQKYYTQFNKSVLILVHRIELLRQASRTIKDITGIDSIHITSETKHLQIGRVYIGMVESVMNRLNMFYNVGLIIVDECHVDNFKKAHGIFKTEKVLGFSATPLSVSKKDPLNNYYSSIVTGPQINQLIELGFLAQNITRCPKEIVDITQLEIDNRKGDFNEAKMATEYRKPKFLRNVVLNYHKYCLGEKTIIFNVNIAHSKELCELFKTVGYNARHLDASSTDRPSIRSGFNSEREEIIDWFKHTEDAILLNVMITTVGFDEPTIRNVILNFSTLSLVKMIQCSGRGSRKIPGKDHFNIIDMGGNCVRFGDWSDDRNWEDIFYNPSKPSEGVAPVKTCPNCEGLIHASSMQCFLHKEDGSLCGHIFERKPQAIEQDMEEMILLTKGIDVNFLIDKHKKKYEYFTMFEMAVDVVKNLYEKYPEPSPNQLIIAFKMYYNLCIEWYDKYKAGKDGNIHSIVDSAFHLKLAKRNFDDLIKKYKPQHTLDGKSQLV